LPSERRKEEIVADEDKIVFSIAHAFYRLLKLSVCAQLIRIEAYHVTQYFRGGGGNNIERAAATSAKAFRISSCL